MSGRKRSTSWDGRDGSYKVERIAKVWLLRRQTVYSTVVMRVGKMDTATNFFFSHDQLFSGPWFEAIRLGLRYCRM